ncbi:hypothetical protein B0H11DRAFT_2076825 [Mycena galericulata]|nr:hypothetical protein B0H11DRAFT_2126494 [Mycena galericulata]KAJ7450674.1 hypothetical protein B0H11DRAFT_2076825 [Mycena galericulata]
MDYQQASPPPDSDEEDFDEKYSDDEYFPSGLHIVLPETFGREDFTNTQDSEPEFLLRPADFESSATDDRPLFWRPPSSDIATATQGNLYRIGSVDLSIQRELVDRAPGGPTILNQFNNYSNMQGATINQTTSDIHQTSTGMSAFDFLHQYIDAGALHNSSGRSQTACHPNTRDVFLKSLEEWAEHPSAYPRVLWLNGPAGIGKSAIVQDFARQCKQLGASFFFRRNHPTRGAWKHFFPTLAYQLGNKYLHLKEALSEVVATDKLVVEQTLELQFNKLFLGPLRCHSSAMENFPIVVIDGLDECEDFKVQHDLITLFLHSIQEYDLPIRLLISSRPELNIQQAFRSFNEDLCTRWTVAPDHIGVRQFLTDTLEGILKPEPHSQYPCSPPRDPEPHWPTEDQIRILVERSSGAYIYAAVVKRYVADANHPRERLQEVMELNPASTSPLDALYHQIVFSCTLRSPRDRFVDILKAASQGMHPEDIDELLELPRHTARQALSGMHSLLNIPVYQPIGLRTPIVLYHSTFLDHLEDQVRSNEFFILSTHRNSKFLQSAIKLLSKPPTLARRMDLLHVELLESLRTILRFHPPDQSILEGLSKDEFQRCLTPVGQSEAFMHRLRHWVNKHEESDVKKKMLHDIEDFLYVSDFDSTLWMKPVDCPAGPTEDLDRMYKELCKNPQILRFLRTLNVWRRFNVYSSLPMEYLGISWLDLRPVTQLKSRLKRPISFRSDEYPFEFLSRPDRAGEFFQEKAQIRQETALGILAYVKEILKQHRRPLHTLEWNWLDHILISNPTKAIIDEVSALDISLFCKHAREEPEYHHQDHHTGKFDEQILRIMQWLQVRSKSFYEGVF